MANSPTFIVKRAPEQTEPYDERKLYASIYAACLSVHTQPGSAELTAQKICQHLLSWLEDKVEVTSRDIRRKTSDFLQVYNPDAAYMYERHRIIG